ncbi:aldolase/citrate lyase family protein [Streptomyces sp. SID3343]|uniref:HpcH/HpaI aldolase family protein n=1 Tax=Streptomyces sp. SID3343 TaxID=2690260 RepID=UPI00136C9627|nr:aldolase/citrate lyase family protein [Streptomyces sp. SID3343]MYW01999.1 2-dehydro-3-deoxyglucarate aldolase [Streptomyces sp. SID3343]
MTAPRDLKSQLAAEARPLGVLVRLPAEQLLELAGSVDLDFAVIDCEHGPADHVALHHHIAVAEAVGLTVLVRVGAADDPDVLRALDLGAAGVIVPHVRDAREAARAVAAAHYPPLGERGFAGYTRAGRYGARDAAEHLALAARRTLVVVMIEDAAGVEAAEEILAVEGVDAVLVGPADLAVSLGTPGPEGAETVAEATRRVHAAARRHGRAVLTITGSPAGAERAFADGADFVVYNTTLLLRSALTAAAAIRRDHRADRTDTSADKGTAE